MSKIRRVYKRFSYLVRAFRHLHTLRTHAHIERGCTFVCPSRISFTGHVSIGSGCFVSAETGEIRMGHNTSLNRNCHIEASNGGRITIEGDCLMGPHVTIHTGGHKYKDPMLPIAAQGDTRGDIHIEGNTWIGANATILGGVRICRSAVVAAGAVVTRDVAPMNLARGVPACMTEYRGKNGKVWEEHLERVKARLVEQESQNLSVDMEMAHVERLLLHRELGLPEW